ncbi:hypothetical protein Hanom_Chr13g01192851 [Helianthus anomalus]
MSEDPPFLFIFFLSIICMCCLLDLPRLLQTISSVFFSMYESGSSIKGVYFLFGKIIDYLAINQGMFMCSFFFFLTLPLFHPSISWYLIISDQRWKETSAKQSNGSSSP